MIDANDGAAALGSVLDGIYRTYRKLPDPVRGVARLLAMPRRSLAVGLVVRAAAGQVVAGPFKGMKLELSPVSSRRLLGYMLGTQELELWCVVEDVIRRRYRTILNIGAGDGYYTIGLALRSPQSTIVAFELLPELRQLVAAGARKNSVAERIRMEAACGVRDLCRELERSEGPILVVMDVEGAEVELLDPALVPALSAADILVETHDPFVHGSTATLINRFEATHAIRQYTARPRTLDEFPPGFLPRFRRLFPATALALMDEHRTGTQHWLFMTSKGHDRSADKERH
jgi:hypothetical protein